MATCTLETKIITYDGKDNIGDIRDQMVPGSSPPQIEINVKYEIHCVQAGECEEKPDCAWDSNPYGENLDSLDVQLPLADILSDTPATKPPWPPPPTQAECMACLEKCSKKGWGDTQRKQRACWESCNEQGGPCAPYTIDESKVIDIIKDALKITLAAMDLPCACGLRPPLKKDFWKLGCGVKAYCDELCMRAGS